MMDLLEQMKTRAEQAQTAYEAYKAECEKVEELPEAWYLHKDGDCGVSYSAGSASPCDNWCETLTGVTNHSRGYADSSSYFRKVTAAEYNNARALYHGADFTGRLHEIDRPVCELNKATRDEMFALPYNSLEAMHVKQGYWFECYANTEMTLGDEIEDSDVYSYTFRLRAPKMRPMTRKEVLAWASSSEAFGWVVRWGDCDGCGAQAQSYILAMEGYRRAPIATLNDDGTGGEWEAFEVEV